MISDNAAVPKQQLSPLLASVTCSCSLFEHTQSVLLHFLQEVPRYKHLPFCYPYYQAQKYQLLAREHAN